MAAIVLEVGLGRLFKDLQFDTLIHLYALLLSKQDANPQLMQWARLAKEFLIRRDADVKLDLYKLNGFVQAISFSTANLAPLRKHFVDCWPSLEDHMERNKAPAIPNQLLRHEADAAAPGASLNQ